jgi:hypothetical protein
MPVFEHFDEAQVSEHLRQVGRLLAATGEACRVWSHVKGFAMGSVVEGSNTTSENGGIPAA